MAQKSRINWIRGSDNNSNFFHKMTLVRHCKLWTIVRRLRIRDPLERFSRLSLPINGERARLGAYEIPLFERRLDQREVGHISRVVTSEEICNVVRELPKGKAPGPSGLGLSVPSPRRNGI